MQGWAVTYFQAISRALKKAIKRQELRDGDIEAAIEWSDDGARFALEQERIKRDKEAEAKSESKGC
jgi:hypothetical protein